MDANRFSGAYQHGEGRTGLDQHVSFSCPSGELDDVRTFLRSHVRTINPVVNYTASVGHGGYARYSRYSITKHDYAGGGQGYIELITIEDPPDGRCGIVIHEYSSYDGSVFVEWKTLEQAQAAFKKFWSSRRTEERFLKEPGFKRRVACGGLEPWFYAVGEEELVGDFTLAHGLDDDPVYRLGRPFIIPAEDGLPVIKVCMGARFYTGEDPFDCRRKCELILVYWDDGSSTSLVPGKSNHLRPLEDGQLWIAEAIREFRRMLAGKSTQFTIDFLTGDKFVGKVIPAKKRAKFSRPGDYSVSVSLKGKRKPKEGLVSDFKPTDEFPDIVQYVTKKFANEGKEVIAVKVRRYKAPGEQNDMKWEGVFFSADP